MPPPPLPLRLRVAVKEGLGRFVPVPDRVAAAEREAVRDLGVAEGVTARRVGMGVLACARGGVSGGGGGMKGLGA